MENFNINKRSKNFSPNEKSLLINLVIKYKIIIENKKTDAMSLDAKKNAWIELSNEFNATSDTKRSAQQLKAFYKNSKANLKKDIASDKIETYKTGGGSFKKKVDENNPLLDIVNREVTPITNKFDSSSDYLFDEITMTTSDDDIEIDGSGDAAKSSTTESGPSAARRYTRKRKSNEELKNYMKEIAELRKVKLEAEIEKSRAKTKVYEKKFEILQQMIDEGN